MISLSNRKSTNHYSKSLDVDIVATKSLSVTCETAWFAVEVASWVRFHHHVFLEVR